MLPRHSKGRGLCWVLMEGCAFGFRRWCTHSARANAIEALC